MRAFDASSDGTTKRLDIFEVMWRRLAHHESHHESDVVEFVSTRVDTREAVWRRRRRGKLLLLRRRRQRRCDQRWLL